MRIEQVFWIADYLRYLWNSHSRHGTHSPFVYSLADQVLYRKDEPECLDFIELERSRLLQFKTSSFENSMQTNSVPTSIETPVKGVNRLKNRNFYKSIPPRKYLSFLFRFLNWDLTTFSNFLELGSSMGAIPAIIQEVDPTVTGWIIDPLYDELSSHGVANDSFLEISPNFKKTSLLVPLDASYLKEIIGKIGPTQKLDFIAINDCWDTLMDENSAYWLMDIISDYGVIMINRLDEFWKQRDLWDRLIRHPRATASIDLFKMGIIFVRKEQLKETFILRY